MHGESLRLRDTRDLYYRGARLRLQTGLRKVPALPPRQLARLCGSLDQVVQFVLAASKLRVYHAGWSAAWPRKAGGR